MKAIRNYGPPPSNVEYFPRREPVPIDIAKFQLGEHADRLRVLARKLRTHDPLVRGDVSPHTAWSDPMSLAQMARLLRRNVVRAKSSDFRFLQELGLVRHSKRLYRLRLTKMSPEQRELFSGSKC